MIHRASQSYNYRTRAIITRSLYTFYPIFESQKRFLRNFFRKILILCTIGIQEQFVIKSGLWWRAYGNVWCNEKLNQTQYLWFDFYYIRR